MKKNMFVSALALFALTLSGVAQADTLNHIEVSRFHAKEAGYKNIDFVQQGSLSEDSSRTYSIPTTAGVNYAVIGACGANCSDLDIAILKDGVELEMDFEIDDSPMVEFVADAATYQVRVEMEDCSGAACDYRIERLSK